MSLMAGIYALLGIVLSVAGCVCMLSNDSVWGFRLLAFGMLCSIKSDTLLVNKH